MRERVVEELRREPGGLDVSTLATRLGIHPNTVRWHLGSLHAAGAVEAEPIRTPSRGRPRMVYRLTSKGSNGGHSEYRLLASILSGAVAETPDGGSRAEQAGRTWGRYLVERPLPLLRPTAEQAVREVASLLDEQGFATETRGGEIRMRRCPFKDLAEAQPEIVCAVHRGLIDGALAELGAELEVTGLDVFVEPDLCVARIARRGETKPNA